MITLIFSEKQDKYKDKYTITGPACPVWTRGDDIPLIKQKLQILLSQAREQNTSEKIAEREKLKREYLLRKVVGLDNDI